MAIAKFIQPEDPDVALVMTGAEARWLLSTLEPMTGQESWRLYSPLLNLLNPSGD